MGFQPTQELRMLSRMSEWMMKMMRHFPPNKTTGSTSICFLHRQACGKEQFQPFLQNQYSMFQCIGESDNNGHHIYGSSSWIINDSSSRHHSIHWLKQNQHCHHILRGILLHTCSFQDEIYMTGKPSARGLGVYIIARLSRFWFEIIQFRSK